MMSKVNVHYTAEYIINPSHPVTVNVIGCGGTGSQVLNSLARMNHALKALGHPGLFITAYDPDKVTAANMGRQLFSPADIEGFKCIALIGKINRFFGTDWDACPELYSEVSRSANITISCVDTAEARKKIKAILFSKDSKPKEPRVPTQYGYVGSRSQRYQPYELPYYWMDFGNMMDRGQVVIGTTRAITQPVSSEFNCIKTLPTIDKLHPDIFRKSKSTDQGPSCSLAEALQKQDLFINTNLANMGLAILWKMFKDLRIFYNGCYINLETLSVNPIKIS
jgi:PRTRC genetic system ThiF family protein